MRKTSSFTTSLALAFAVITPQAFAQTIEEIVVTAQKRTESIQDVPVSVTAYTGEDLEERNIQSISSIADVTPNLLIQTGGTGNNLSSVFIRGIGQSSQQVFFDQGVGTYVDGVYRPTAHGGLIDLLNVERVEVLRGPQGDLYGKNAVGGAISIITKQPDVNETFGSITAAAGSYDRKDARAFVNLPLSEGKLGLQLSAAARNADGYIETEAIEGDDDLGSQENIALRAALKWQINENASWTVSVDELDMESSGSPMNHVRILATSAFHRQHNNAVAEGLLGNTPAISSAFVIDDEFESNITGDQHRNKSNERTVISRLEYDMGWAQLVALSSYKRMKANDGFDADGSPIDISANNRDIDNRSTSHELQLNGLAFDDRLNYLAGLYYLQDEIEFNTFAENNISTAQLVGIYPGYRDRSSRNLTDQELDSFAAYFNLAYDVTDKMTMIVGGRYMSEEKDFTAGLTRGAVTNPTSTQASADEDWSNFSPKFQVQYDVNDDVMVYATFATAFKSGGINNQVNAGPAGTFLVPFEEEEVESIELGLKGTWLDGTLQTNIALFSMDYTDLQVSILDFNVITGTQIRTIANSGSADIQGWEFEGIWAPTENFSLLLSGAYLDATYGEDVLQDPADPSSILFVDGDPLAFAPEYSYALSAVYEVPMGEGATLRFRGDYSWRDQVYFEPEGLLVDREAESEDDYGLLNVSVTYDSGNDWYISAYGTNVTDETYKTGTFIQTRAVGVEWH